jgi:hypothetical protein
MSIYGKDMMPVEPPQEAKKEYELVVWYNGSEEGAHEFAEELATEFGCDVGVIDLATGEMAPVTSPNGKGKPTA